jgi:predicted site-specific integrase-resolvase
MEDKLLTVAQASELAGVSTESIRRWTNSGRLKLIVVQGITGGLRLQI